MTTTRWFQKTIAQVDLAGGFEITTTTDVPCHLWLYWTEKEPWVHRSAKVKRGLSIPWAAYWCFVAWHKLEQTEAGDTTTHTFTWLGWVVCETKWFAFHGTIAGVDSPSDAPIFHKHYTYIPPVINEFTRQGAASGDDCVKGKYRGAWYWGLTYGYIFAGFYDSNYRAGGGGMRFLNIPLSPTSTIISAKLSFFTYRLCEGLATKSRLKAEANLSPAVFSTMANYDARPKLPTVLTWDNIPVWPWNTWNDSIDIGALITAIITQPGWASGNPLALYWDDHEERSSSASTNSRWGQSWDSGDHTIGPKLYVKYNP